MLAQVILGNSVSSGFEVSNGVKQGSVLALTLFFLYLPARGIYEHIYIQTGPDADSLRTSQLRAKTSTTDYLVRVLVAHNSQEIITTLQQTYPLPLWASLRGWCLDHNAGTR